MAGDDEEDKRAVRRGRRQLRMEGYAAAAEVVARIRMVRCPKCDTFLPELPAYSIYVCGGCGAALQGMQVVVIPAKDSRGQSEEAREALYHALSHHRRFLSHLYFYAIAMCTALLIFRPPDVMFSMSVEMSVAFALVTMAYYGLVLHSSVWVTPLQVSRLDQWARGMGMWYFTACWMIFYTINIPPALYQSRHMVITCFFLVLTLAITLLSKVSRFAFLFGQGW